MMPKEFISGFVLAGGRSRRMGLDKTQIPWREGTLLSHAVEVMREAAGTVFIVSSREIQAPLAPVLADKVEDRGPLAGIHTALSATATDWNVMLAVDLPLVSASLLRFIADACSGAAEQVVIPRIQGKLQTLCAAYHRRVLAECDAALRNGESSIVRFLTRIPMRTLVEAELSDQGFPAEMFLNVNTPDDIIRAQGAAESR